MTTATSRDPGTAITVSPTTLVWIDSREAVVVRCRDDIVDIDHIRSEVPAHHRATGHVRHDPAIRHGGGGAPQTAGEPKRLEHLRQFIAGIADQLSPEDDLLILGSGTTHARLARHLSKADEHHRRHRRVTCEVAPRLTDRQLVARLRTFAGSETRRHTVGAYRWTTAPADRRSGPAQAPPRRVVAKPRHDRIPSGP